MSVSESDYRATVDSLQLLIFLYNCNYTCFTMIEKCPKSNRIDLRTSKIQKIPWGACPQTPLATALLVHIALGPPTENKEPPHSRIRLRACMLSVLPHPRLRKQHLKLAHNSIVWCENGANVILIWDSTCSGPHSWEIFPMSRLNTTYRVNFFW